jgi:methionine synthase II (cobalamin-independent)
VFATLLGGLPRPPLPNGASSEAQVEAIVRAQETAGLEPITDGGLLAADDPTIAWRATQSLTARAVKQVLTGPYTTRATAEEIDRLNLMLRELAAAGCPLVEIHEPGATGIGTDPDARARFRDLHVRLLDGVTGTHLALAITGGSAKDAGIETLLAAPYASLAVDLIAGPDNWNLVVATPGDRGIVCGALPAAADSADGPETLLWAAGYAASTGGRGPERVGIATASSLAHLPWETAVAKMERLGAAVRIASSSPEERRAALDPRAIDSRSAALGRYEPAPSRPPRRGPDPT